MSEFKTVDVIDYLGKYQNGVVSLISICYKNEFTEAILYYSNELLTLTVDESIEKDLGMPIELCPEYRDLLTLILKKVVPYDDIVNRLDDIDFSKYFGASEINTKEGEEIDENNIKK